MVVAQRLCDSATGGQILASQLVRGLVGSRGGHTFRSVGPLQLKGFAEPVEAYAVDWTPRVDRPAEDRQAGQERLTPVPLPPLLGSAEHTTFVGRKTELAQLQRVWEQVRLGEQRLFLLAGEPGVGKTRLAAEFAVAVHAQGATVLFGRCDEDAVISYQPFVEALRHYLASLAPHELQATDPELADVIPEAVALIPELAERAPDFPPLPTEESEGARYRLFEAMTSLLARAAQLQPVVLLLDDLHWADKQTARLLKHIVRSGRKAPLLILGTYREAEVAPGDALVEMLADLRRDRAFEKLSLLGLDEEDAGALIGERAGRDAPPAFIRAVHERTEGNPFFTEEVLRYLAETGAIHQSDGRLTTKLAVAQLGIPEGVKEVVGHRLARLSEECNSVLTIASVIGREFGIDALERASGLALERLLELLEEAVAAHVVAELPSVDGHYMFAHPLIYEALYDELTTTRRVRLHGQMLQYADSDGAKLAYEVLGVSGPALVAVGISNCPAVRTRNKIATQQWGRVTQHCRVILYDRRGVGFSSSPERGYSLMASVEDLRAVLDAAGVERAVLWGAADGGPLAIAFAAMHPERVACLLLLGTTAKYTSDVDFPWGVSQTARDSFQRVGAVDRGRAVSDVYQARPSPGAGAFGEVMRRVPPGVWWKLLGGVSAADARSLLTRLRVPTLIIHDPDNSYIPVEAAQHLHEQIAGSELFVTNEYGTGIFGEAVYEKIGAFVEQATASGGP